MICKSSWKPIQRDRCGRPFINGFVAGLIATPVLAIIFEVLILVVIDVVFGMGVLS